MVAYGLDWDIILIGNQFVVKTFLVWLERMSDNFQKGRLKSLRVLLNFVLNDGLNDKLKDLSNGHNTQWALTESPNKGVIFDNH